LKGVLTCILGGKLSPNSKLRIIRRLTFAAHYCISELNLPALIAAMASETESKALSALTSPCDVASDVTDVSIGSEGALEELELPEHDEHSIPW
jgi:hypothetical protein